MYDERDNKFLERAIEISRQGMKSGQGGPFGCVIVLGDEIIGEGCNQVTSSNDPTAHAEVVAIRQACNKLGTYQLTDCDIYTSCEPCPMCLGAIYWARPKRVIYANTREEAAAIEFDDDFIYGEIIAKMEDRKIPFLHLPHPMAKEVFEAWKNWEGKIKY
ncbi:MAG: nucleoside deaminase [Chitinophagaceae bacterium]|nr:nucleoside deaminase [Chitinophagaceae bacterium]MBL0304493.1 nucleoside deaminase [Chitinophagaceae bacterium]MBP6215136.1 nucleoside deaminase [Chitinophagaceae bacterium]